MNADSADYFINSDFDLSISKIGVHPRNPREKAFGFRLVTNHPGVTMKRIVFTTLFATFLIAGALAQEPDPQLLAYIETIKAVDNHAHVLAPDVADDKGYDALRCEGLPPGTAMTPANLRFGRDTQESWKALYGVVP